MTKTNTQKNAEYIALLEQNGFAPNGEEIDGRPVYARRWSRQAEVLWYGEMEASLEIRADIDLGYPLISIFKDGRFEDRRGHTSPKRSINAMREIVRFAGFDFEGGAA